MPEHLRGDSAVELGGNGTVEAPYQISTTDDLVFAMQQINSDESYRSACFVLTADIDLSGISWQAIGTAGAPFTGTFDGGNHRISNLNLVVNAEYQGFFGVTEDAYIHNMIVQGSVTGSDYAGGIVGYASGDTVIEACQSKVDVTAYLGTAAGVAGVNEGTIRHCIQTGDIQGPEAAAGIAGRNEGTIEHCYSIGTLTAQNTGAGGIAVENSGTIRCCAAMEEFITVTEPGTIGRIAVSNTGTLESNYVWSEMELTGTVTDDEILNGKESAVTLISKNRELFPEDMWTLREGFYPMLIGQTDMNYILPHQVSDGRELIGTINIIIPEPEAGKAPVTELAGDGWSAVVEWSPAVNGTFAYDTAYTAVITVTLEDGYVLDDAAVFYVNGIEKAFAGDDPYTVTVEFEKTGAKPADPAAGAEGGDASGTGAAVKTGVNDFVMQMVLLVLISGAAVIAAIRIRKNRL